MSRGSRKRWPIGVGGCLLIGGILFGLAILIPVIAFLVWQSAGNARAQALLAEVRAKGEPVDAEGLEAYYAQPPTNSDSTDTWLAAIEGLSTKAFDEDARPLPIVGLSEEEIPPPGQAWGQQRDVEALLNKYDVQMQQLHDAASLGDARYRPKMAEGLEMLLPHVQQIRTGARMLSLEAHVRAHKGDASGAAESIIDTLRLSESLKNEPLLISQLVRIAVAGIATGLTKDLLPHTEFSDQDLERLQQALREPDYRQGMKAALIGERVMGLQAQQNPGQLSGTGTPVPAVGRAEDQALYLELMGKMIDSLDQPWPDARQAAKNVDAQFKGRTASTVGKMRFILTSLLFPALSSALEAGARADASRGAVDALLAVERYQREHGKPPKTLDSLVPKYLPKVPLDPYDGQPLRYKVTADKVTVYSIGRDDTDDGGKTSEALEPDVAFSLPLKPAQP